MRVFNLARVLAAAVVLALTVVSCGGGGGGGGGIPLLPAAGTSGTTGATGAVAPGSDGASTNPPSGESSQPLLDPDFSTIDVSVGSVTPSSLVKTLYEDAAPTELFIGTASGNVQLLNGKTIYIIIEDRDRLLDGKADGMLGSANNGGGSAVRVRTTFSKTIKPGHYTGSFNVYVCLDPRCSVRFKDMPFKLPYDVTIKASTNFAETQSRTIDLHTPFSTSPKTFSLPLTPAEGTPASTLELSGGANLEFNPELSLAKAVITHHADGHATLDVTIPPLVNGGKYKLGWEVITYNISPSRRILAVNLTVDPDPALPYAFGTRDIASVVTPVSVFEKTVQISPPFLPSPAELLVSSGAGVMVLEGYDFVDASGNPTANPANYTSSMLRVFNSKTDDIYRFRYLGWGWITSVIFTPCNPERTACVPPGIYHVRLRYRLQFDDAAQTVYFPVKLTVVP